uniref:Uncharacterized protein n=1 Tax=Mycena chlorophos TaxID=658473 RepID=A0ABQ0L0P3_MYCCL|nr:predicted protein [Mycena chlorophos]
MRLGSVDAIGATSFDRNRRSGREPEFKLVHDTVTSQQLAPTFAGLASSFPRITGRSPMNPAGNSLDRLRERLARDEAAPAINYSDAQREALARQYHADAALRDVIWPVLDSKIPQASAAGFYLEVNPQSLQTDEADLLTGLTAQLSRGSPPEVFAGLTLHAEEASLVIKANTYARVLFRDSMPVETVKEREVEALFDRFIDAIGKR